jgi:hypothetical protein
MIGRKMQTYRFQSRRQRERFEIWQELVKRMAAGEHRKLDTFKGLRNIGEQLSRRPKRSK